MGAASKFQSNSISSEILFKEGFGLKIESRGGLKLSDWAAENSIPLNEALLKHSAILFRGFDVDSPEFKSFVDVMSGGIGSIEYKGGTSPRKKIADGLYESTTYPSGAEIPQHHELSYLTKWPLKAYLHCAIPAATGGATPICSGRTFMKKINPKIIEAFRNRKVMYLRNFHLFGPTWQMVFATESRGKVEEFCKSMNISSEWLAGERLRTRQVAQGVATHPLTGELFYFNQSHALNMHSTNPSRLGPFLEYFKPGLKPEQLKQLSSLSHEDMPFVSYFGDGGFIEDSMVQEILGILDSEKVRFPWQKGDVVYVDNMLATHGREAFTGDRKVLVSFTNNYSEGDNT